MIAFLMQVPPMMAPKFRDRLVRLTVYVVLGGLLSPVTQAADDEKKIPSPREVTLQTADGVTLGATYYASNLGKEAVPIVLLHAAKGSRADFEDLALRLQSTGKAVLVPDLRGHGANRSADLHTEDYLAMVNQDVEAVKKFLMAENNAGELNIDKLGLVGVEMGASVASIWAVLDWSWPVLATGKQGQDVKALVLISPEWIFKGLRFQDVVSDSAFRSQFSIMIIAGKGVPRNLTDAKRIYNTIERLPPHARSE